MERTGGARGAEQGAGSGFALSPAEAGATGGDTAAFAAQVSRYAPHLYDFLARLSGRTEAADALLRQAASQAAMGASSAAQWPSERAWFFSRAFAVLSGGSSAASGDLATFAAPDRAQLPPGDDAATEAMARAVWRAVSALPHDQHALLHLRVREAMVPGEAASVLGITEREASDRLSGLTAAVEETSRALFLLRHGRAHDAALNDLLAGRDTSRLTPELRVFLRDYVRDTPAVRAMLAPVPPLAVYAAFVPLPIPPALAHEAVEAATPWLAAGKRVPPPIRRRRRYSRSSRPPCSTPTPRGCCPRRGPPQRPPSWGTRRRLPQARAGTGNPPRRGSRRRPRREPRPAARRC